MKVISRKCSVGLNGERHVKGVPFDVDENTGNRLITQGTVELVETINVPEVKVTLVEPNKSTEEIPVAEPITKIPEVPKPEPEIPAEEKPAEDEFKKVGGRWKRKKPE